MTMLKNPVRLATIAAIVIIALISALLWTTVMAPQLSRVSALDTEVAQLGLANVSALKQERQIQTLAEQAPELARQAQELYSRMPQTAELPIVLQQITKAATDAGIRPADITVLNTGIPESVVDEKHPEPGSAGAAAESVGVKLATMGIEVTVTGTNRQLLAFLDNLQSLDRAVLITETGFATAVDAAAPGPRESLTVRGTMFVLESKLPDLVTNAQRVIDEARARAESAAE